MPATLCLPSKYEARRRILHLKEDRQMRREPAECDTIRCADAHARSCAVPSLSIIVVITEISLRAKAMNPGIAAALIGAALLSVMLFATIAGVLPARKAGPRRRGHSGIEPGSEDRSMTRAARTSCISSEASPA